MPWDRCFLFMGISAAYHILLTGFLVFRREDFRLEESQTPLTRVNLPNTLTFGRLSSIPTLLYLVLQASAYPQSLSVVIVPLMCVVFVTDFLDGIVARRRRQITFVGRYLDSASDYLMIIALSIAFYYYRLVPTWFFWLIMARLVLFAAGMAVLALRDREAKPVSTFLGKASIFAVMVLYVLEAAGLLGVPYIGAELVVRIVEYAVAAVIAASFVDKAVFLIRMFSAPGGSMKAPQAGRSS
jgi:phosphatidylglycerophosphate synthase